MLFCSDEVFGVFRVFPVVPDVLDVIVVFEHFDHLRHVLEGVLVGQLDVSGRDILDFRGGELVAGGLQAVTDSAEVGDGGTDLEDRVVVGSLPRRLPERLP